MVGKKQPISKIIFNSFFLFDHFSLLNSLCLYRVLVHGKRLPDPIAHMGEVNFNGYVHHVLQKVMGFKDLSRTQSVTWPHLLRGNSLVLVNGSGTGKLGE